MKGTEVTTITVDRDFISIFSTENYPQHIRGGMVLTDQIKALNLRFRESAAGYKTDWHVAGDPTLIVIQEGTLRITLRDQSFREFSTGEAFIAKDFLPLDLAFDQTQHGHQASVIGEQALKAVHIKLSSQPFSKEKEDQ